MAFKDLPPPDLVPETPDLLILELPRRKIPDVLPHQREILRAYATEGIAKKDVALQLPTGSGKTLVGLLIAEWRRRKYGEHVVYLCPTKQLVNQTVEQADEKYGLSVLGFTGGIKTYTPAQRAEYQSGARVAVTTYNSLFNTNPFFDNPDIVILDDAHAADNYVASMWSMRIERAKSAHAPLHKALQGVLRAHLDAANFARLSGKWEEVGDRDWVDKLPMPLVHELRDELAEVFDTHVSGAGLQHEWSTLREHLHACQVYLSFSEILVRPLIPPTWTHDPFAHAKQRIYMSATLGAGGDLERLTGRHSIHRIKIPEGWDRQGVGRRFFMFPESSLAKDDVTKLRRELIQKAGRALMLVPSDKAYEKSAADIRENLKCPVFSADNIEASKKPFVAEPRAVAVVANRYDGIDFPGSECRLLFVEGLPRLMSAQERFLGSRMGANALLKERIQTRTIQAIGRCTRSLEDFSAVVVTGQELTDELVDTRRRKYLHPELQAEIDFGARQSMNTTLEDFVENFSIFIENGRRWETVNKVIVTARAQISRAPFPAMDELHAAVKHEVDYQKHLWATDYEAAVDAAESVLGKLAAPELKGYRALWHYLAGSAARLGAIAGGIKLVPKAKMHYGKAKEVVVIPWLVQLARFQPSDGAADASKATDRACLGQIERIERMLSRLGTVHDRAYARREREILSGLESPDTFESAHRALGEMLGFDAGKVEREGSPDPWWIADSICFVFEDHAGAEDDSALDVTKARQVSTHPAWMRANVEASKDAEIIPVLVTPVAKVRAAALPHLNEVAYWGVREFREWAAAALGTIRELRRTFFEPGDLEWRATAIQVFQEHGLDAVGLAAKLRAQKAASSLTPVGDA